MVQPTVAIIGRPNVGKSTLFNRIIEERLSIVDDVPGVTRDRIYARGEWLGRHFSIIDTGGLTLDDEPINKQIEMQVDVALEEADVIVYVADVSEGMTALDEDIAQKLYTADKPVVLMVNKVDNPERRSQVYEFYSLGLGEPYPVSAEHGLGLGDALDAIIAHFPKDTDIDVDESIIRFSLIGRPNVGKSSLVNAIIGEERVIVSNEPGTTRDAVDTSFVDEDGNEFTMIDTAGIRKKGKIYESTEHYSVLRALRAIERSDIVLLVIDAEEGIVEQDKRIAGIAHEQGKGIVIAYNKWDLVDKDSNTIDEYQTELLRELPFLSYAPVIFVSALTKKRLHQIPALLKEISDNQNRRIQSSTLNEVIQDAVAMHQPPSDKGNRLRIYYGTQVSVKPPTFVIFVNDKELMHFSYERYLENQFRESFEFGGTPVHIITRERK